VRARLRLAPKQVLPTPQPPLTMPEHPIKRSTPAVTPVTLSSPHHTLPTLLPTITTTLHSHDTRPIGPSTPCAQVPRKEGKEKEEGKERREQVREKRGKEKEQKRGDKPSKSLTPPSPLETVHGQDPPRALLRDPTTQTTSTVDRTCKQGRNCPSAPQLAPQRAHVADHTPRELPRCRRH
jgi:hypothetical protein